MNQKFIDKAKERVEERILDLPVSAKQAAQLLQISYPSILSYKKRLGLPAGKKLKRRELLLVVDEMVKTFPSKVQALSVE